MNINIVQINQKCVLFQGLVRLRQFLGLTLWLGQARGPSDAAISSNEHKNS